MKNNFRYRTGSERKYLLEAQRIINEGKSEKSEDLSLQDQDSERTNLEKRDRPYNPLRLRFG